MAGLIIDYLSALISQPYLEYGQNTLLAKHALLHIGLFFSTCNRKVIFVLFLPQNMCCGYSLEVPCQGSSNDSLPTTRFHGEIKTYVGPPLTWSYAEMELECMQANHCIV